jgi:lysophospholipase L1-like esterase
VRYCCGNSIHPLFRGHRIADSTRSVWSEFHPVLGFRVKSVVSPVCGLTTDRYGFIHNGDPQRLIEKDSFKIFLVGGSTVAGHGASCNDRTLPAQLEQKLRKKYRNVVVINAGVPGYYASQELIRIQNEIVFYKPDLIVSVTGTNDRIKGFSNAPFKGEVHSYYIPDYSREISRKIDQLNSNWFLLKALLGNIGSIAEYSYTRYLLAQLLRETRKISSSGESSDIVNKVIGLFPDHDVTNKDLEKNINPIVETDMIDKGIYYYAYYLNAAQKSLEVLGIPHFAVLQPSLLIDDRQRTAREDEALRYSRRGLALRYGLRDPLVVSRCFWSKAAETFDKRGMKWLDFRRIFPDRENVYADYSHYNDLGNEIFAEKLFLYLENQKFLAKLKTIE